MNSATPALTVRGYQASDGAVLPLRYWGPEDPAAVVLGLHGFGDYANAFDQPASQLAAHGIRVYAYDQRGFGRSPGRGRWHGEERMIRDAVDAVRLLAARHPARPIYLLGLSMGGAVAMTAAASEPDLPLAGMVLVAPAVWGREFMPAYQRLALERGAHVVPWYPLSGGGLRITPSDNLEMLRRLSRDPLVQRHFRVDTIWGLTNLMDRAADSAAKIRVPTLLLYGLRDQLIPLGATRQVLQRIDPEWRRVGVYEKGYHMLLRDRAGSVVVEDVAAWVLDAAKPLLSGAEAGWKKHLNIACLPPTCPLP